MAKILIKRVDDAYAFEACDENGHLMRMDAAEAIGGHNSGIRPMQTLLMGLGGCGGRVGGGGAGWAGADAADGLHHRSEAVGRGAVADDARHGG